MITISKRLGLIGTFVFAQVMMGTAQQPVEMADGMRANGKSYVVVAIVLLVLLGLFVYLFRIDRKLKRLEDKMADKS